MERWYHDWKPFAEFHVVYIREAHAADSDWPIPNAPNDPKTLAERDALAGECAKSLKLSIPVLIDEMEDGANKAYAAWPDRMYIVGADRKVVYRGGPGPFGFKPREAREALKEHLLIQQEDY